VLRISSITTTRAPERIRDASHPPPIGRAHRGARRSDGASVVSQTTRPPMEGPVLRNYPTTPTRASSGSSDVQIPGLPAPLGLDAPTRFPIVRRSRRKSHAIQKVGSGGQGRNRTIDTRIFSTTESQVRREQGEDREGISPWPTEPPRPTEPIPNRKSEIPTEPAGARSGSTACAHRDRTVSEPGARRRTSFANAEIESGCRQAPGPSWTANRDCAKSRAMTLRFVGPCVCERIGNVDRHTCGGNPIFFTIAAKRGSSRSFASSGSNFIWTRVPSCCV